MALKETLFDPFVTTKGSRDGSGLGLYIVKEEMGKNHGEINLLDSELGCSFEIRLPLKAS